MKQTRRAFLADVGKGMIVSSIGSSLAAELGLTSIAADESGGALQFGALEPLVDLMQQTSPSRLLPSVVQHLKQGTDLARLVAAAALANARAFGGEDYVGFHTMMALAPAYHMARELPAERQALPVLKVLYRNSIRIQEASRQHQGVLRPVAAGNRATTSDSLLREQVRRKDLAAAEQTFAALAAGPAEETLNHLLPTIEDATEVHRVVMVYRSWDVLDLVGREQAHTLLRQSIHYCIASQRLGTQNNPGAPSIIVPKLLDRYHLLERPASQRLAEDRWLDDFSQTLFRGTPEQAAEAAVAALAEGMAGDAVGEAISLAANQLVLRDNGRPKPAGPNKPAGSIHGDGIGVHACDSANAWRNIARVANPRHRLICLILGAYQVALDRHNRGGDFLHWQPYPREEARRQVERIRREDLMRELDASIRNKDQARASALVHRGGILDMPARPIFDLLLRYAVSEDGALHAEKYYRTVTEEFQTTRPAFRWRQLIALARVTASAYGQQAPGYADACGLLGV